MPGESFITKLIKQWSCISHISYNIRMPSHLFKMDWLLMSIVLLCIMATALYTLINLAERFYNERR